MKTLPNNILQIASSMADAADRGSGDDLISIARAVHIVGDAWSLLIVQQALAGVTRYGEFQKSLGLSPNILAARLRFLVTHGVLERRVCPARRDLNEYVLTEAGTRLKSALVALQRWGETCNGSAPHTS